MLEDDESVVACVRVGARGYLLKGATPDEMERAMRAVANGEVILGPAVAARGALTTVRPDAGAVPFPELTDREREVLDLVARGLRQPHDLASAGAQPEDRAQRRVQRPGQAGGAATGRPRSCAPARRGWAPTEACRRVTSDAGLRLAA